MPIKQLYYKKQKKNFSTLFDPFIPDNLDKGFEKVSKDKPGKEQIGNDLLSLQSFFCNPYIRHKILHPLFLKLRFHKAIRLFYNTQLINTQNESVFKAIQREINRLLVSLGNESEMTPEMNRPIVLCIDDSSKEIAEKIKQNLKVLISPIVSIFIGTPQFPSCYSELCYSQKLKHQYKIEYNELQRIKFEQTVTQNFEMKRSSDEEIRSQPFFPQKSLQSNSQIKQSLGGTNSNLESGPEVDELHKKMKYDEKDSHTTQGTQEHDFNPLLATSPKLQAQQQSWSLQQIQQEPIEAKKSIFPLLPQSIQKISCTTNLPQMPFPTFHQHQIQQLQQMQQMQLNQQQQLQTPQQQQQLQTPQQQQQQFLSNPKFQQMPNQINQLTVDYSQNYQMQSYPSQQVSAGNVGMAPMQSFNPTNFQQQQQYNQQHQFMQAQMQMQMQLQQQQQQQQQHLQQHQIQQPIPQQQQQMMCAPQNFGYNVPQFFR